MVIFRDIDDISMLYNEGALLEAQTIGHIFYTTDCVLNSYGDDNHQVFKLVGQKMIDVKSFADAEFVLVENIYHKHKDILSITDCSVIYFAMATKGTLITNEKALITICYEYGITTNTANNYYEEVKLFKTG
jgi:hypothetical protein